MGNVSQLVRALFYFFFEYFSTYSKKFIVLINNIRNHTGQGIAFFTGSSFDLIINIFFGPFYQAPTGKMQVVFNYIQFQAKSCLEITLMRCCLI
ncbi:MAG: hypothetical protein MUF15_23435 [Acidobacteria bacterium]|nr:hypothetical protein [Acidobacteriota bacterium]